MDELNEGNMPQILKDRKEILDILIELMNSTLSVKQKMGWIDPYTTIGSGKIPYDLISENIRLIDRDITKILKELDKMYKKISEVKA
jgi:hypothetical protein